MDKAKTGPKPIYGDKLTRRTYQLSDCHLTKLDALAHGWGVSKSQALRRIIEAA